MIECHGLDTEYTICFYEQDYYVLSNFSSFSLMWKGIRFDTLEHAYHWEKFDLFAADSSTITEEVASERSRVRELIRTAPSAHVAFQLGQQYKSIRRDDWDKEDENGVLTKVRIMYDLLNAKVDQHDYVHQKLIASGERILVENSWRDDFWGWGPKKDGKNILGKLWMYLRLMRSLNTTAKPEHLSIFK
jgi:ribA/ribD-fused uncharacterized protein